MKITGFFGNARLGFVLGRYVTVQRRHKDLWVLRPSRIAPPIALPTVKNAVAAVARVVCQLLCPVSCVLGPGSCVWCCCWWYA